MTGAYLWRRIPSASEDSAVETVLLKQELIYHQGWLAEQVLAEYLLRVTERGESEKHLLCAAIPAGELPS